MYLLNMTLKTRNRLTLTFLLLSSIVFLFEIALFLIQSSKGTFQLPEISFSKPQNTISLFNVRFSCVVLGICIQNIYICLTTMFILRSFVKTQSSEVFYFLLFLTACLFDSGRILIPLFHISKTYSSSLLIVGNMTLFARLLAPLSLFTMVLPYEKDMHKNVEQIGLILLILSAFLAAIIPINTATIEPNFNVAHSYNTTIKIATILIHIINTITLLLQNLKRETRQFTTLGYILIASGNLLTFNCYNLFSLIAGPIFLISGTFIYFRTVHKYYLWTD